MESIILELWCNLNHDNASWPDVFDVLVPLALSTTLKNIEVILVLGRAQGLPIAFEQIVQIFSDVRWKVLVYVLHGGRRERQLAITLKERQWELGGNANDAIKDALGKAGISQYDLRIVEETPEGTNL